jgi:hypothetical protein
VIAHLPPLLRFHPADSISFFSGVVFLPAVLDISSEAHLSGMKLRSDSPYAHKFYLCLTTGSHRAHSEEYAIKKGDVRHETNHRNSNLCTGKPHNHSQCERARSQNPGNHPVQLQR